MADDRSLTRVAWDSLLPTGSAWNVESDGDLDKYFDGLALDFEIARSRIVEAEHTRDPEKTSVLSDLEIDFGVLPDTNLTEAQRRAYLAAVMGEIDELPSWERFQAKLRAAGFDVYVYPNDPPIDPSGVATTDQLIVNGTCVTEQSKDFASTVCADSSGETTVCADIVTTPASERGSTVGEYDGMIRTEYVYSMPPESRWPFVWFIAASRTSVDFTDWNMERATVRAWDAYGGAVVSKTTDYKTQGIRSLKVLAGYGWSDPIGPYVEQLLDTPIPGTQTVTVDISGIYYSAGGYAHGGLMIRDAAGTWDTAGIVSADAPGPLTYVCTNGVSGVRLYLKDELALLAQNDFVCFDNLRVSGTTFTDATISEALRYRFTKLILRYKPVRVWVAALIDWTPIPVVAGGTEEDDMTYRSQETTPSGTLTITDAEIATHIILKGTASGYTVLMDDARNFTVDRLYRFTNQSSQPIDIENYDGTITDTILPGNVLHATLTDRTTAAGNWIFIQPIAGGGTYV